MAAVPSFRGFGAVTGIAHGSFFLYFKPFFFFFSSALYFQAGKLFFYALTSTTNTQWLIRCLFCSDR